MFSQILDVNHLWDTQYRQLQAETTQEISELKQKIELLTCDDSQKRFDKLWIKTKDMVDVERRAKEQAKEEKQVLKFSLLFSSSITWMITAMFCSARNTSYFTHIF